MSYKTSILQEQISTWDWNPSTDIAVQCLKAWICSQVHKTTLAYFNKEQPIIIQTDTSKYGIGAALIQNRCPITFDSTSLSNVESRYTNTEEEYLSFLLALENSTPTCMAHTWQHKMITSPWKWLTQPHPCHPSYTIMPGSVNTKMWLCHLKQTRKGNGLDRQIKQIPPCKENLPITWYQHIDHIHFSNWWLDIIQGPVERDPIYSTLYRLTINGWPPPFHHVPWIVHHLWIARDELSLENLSMYSIWLPWQDPPRTTSKPQRHRKDAINHSFHHLLSRYWCWYHQLQKYAPNAPVTKPHRPLKQC